MIYLKIKQPLHSLLLLFFVAHAFDVSDVPSDSTQRLGLGQHPDLGLNQNAPRFLESGQAWSDRELSGNPGNKGGSKEPSQRSTLVNVGIGLADADEVVQNQSSELSDLFVGGRRGRPSASVELSSVASVITSEKAFLAKAESGKPIASDVTSASNESKPRSTINVNSRPISNKPLVVPSEGGLMQELSPITSTETKSGTLKGDSVAGNRPEDVQVNESESSTVATFLHQGYIPVVKKQLKPQDSHISARKGANLSEKSEPTSSDINDTTVQFTFSSSESPLIKEIRTQKIAARKGAQPPKIYPRKGVKDKFDNRNSSDPIFTETNNDNGPTSPSPLYASDLGVHDNVKDVTTNRAIPFQNKPVVDFSLKASTPFVSSTSPATRPNRPILETSTPKFETVSNIEVKNNNIYLNVTAPLTAVKNDTLEDKSGIIASYPPLKKRLKPLKTTDTDTLNSSPTPSEHTSSGHDYVVPIVVTILTIPMLVVLVLFLYKKGSEFWERRHYRRMDFLIDGMYND